MTEPVDGGGCHHPAPAPDPASQATPPSMEKPGWLVRRGQLIRLLELLNEGLPVPSRRDHSASGFVNGARSRSCPDCLANGRVMFGCETCGGSGEVTGARVDAVAIPDRLPDDGLSRDPYAVSDQVVAYGVRDTRKLGFSPARDAEIARLGEQIREPFRNVGEEIDAANRSGGYRWERERRQLRRRYDIDAMTVALDELRVTDEPGYRLLHSVYVYGWSEPSVLMEEAVERALRFLDSRMPCPMRAPGDEPRVESSAVQRMRRRKAA